MIAIEKGLSIEEIKNADERYLFGDYQLYVLVDVNEDVYCMNRYSLQWHLRENESFWYVWDCDYSLYVPLSGEEAEELIKKWEFERQKPQLLKSQTAELKQLLAENQSLASRIRELSAYYSKQQDELFELQFDNELKDLYWEMVNLYKDIFVEYYYDAKNERLFQCSAHGEVWLFTKSDCEWWRMPFDDTAKLPRISRPAAENLVDEWLTGKEKND